MERSLEAEVRARASLESVCELLASDPAGILSARPDPEARRSHQYVADLGVDLHGGATARQEVEVELGLPSEEEDEGVVRWPLTWHARTRRHLFPTFAGQLTAVREDDGTVLCLGGRYRPPLGPVGAFGDGVIGHRVARASVAEYLGEVARRLDDEADRFGGEWVRHPAPAPPDRRPARAIAELWLG